MVYIRICLFIIFTSGLFSGCVKTEGILKIKGKILDESTKTGIPYKNIIIQGIVYNNNQSELTEAGQFSTDSAGCFEYTMIKIKGVYHYNFCFSGNPDYPAIVKKKTLGEIKRNEKYLFFYLDRLADLTINIYRKSKTPARDTLHLYWESNDVFGLSLYPYTINNNGRTDNSYGLTSARELWWVGGNVITTINTRVYADKMTKLNWDLYRNGKKEEFTDTIVCKRDFANIVNFTY